MVMPAWEWRHGFLRALKPVAAGTYEGNPMWDFHLFFSQCRRMLSGIVDEPG